MYMEVHLSEDQKAFARQAIETGRMHDENDVVHEALALWERRERTRSEILVLVDAAEASLARGEGRTITEHSMGELARAVNQRGKARLKAEQTAHD